MCLYTPKQGQVGTGFSRCGPQPVHISLETHKNILLAVCTRCCVPTAAVAPWAELPIHCTAAVCKVIWYTAERHIRSLSLCRTDSPQSCAVCQNMNSNGCAAGNMDVGYRDITPRDGTISPGHILYSCPYCSEARASPRWLTQK